jgi:predicted nucleic acid-binding Zn ribbon protein
MSHDTASKAVSELPVPSQEQMMTCVSESCQALLSSRRRRGKPATLSTMHLCLGILYCGLHGFGSQLALWRRLCMEPMGPFAPIQVVDQAVYNRLARAEGQMQRLFELVSAWMRQRLDGWQDRSLAPFAHQVLALDESTLDAVGRWLPELHTRMAGDPKLLAGRLSALFDIRLQQWVRVDLLPEATANCKAHAREMVDALQAGVLLLFDRGYLSFPWFDHLTERGLFWISRYANEVTFQVRHVLYQGDGVLDEIVWLGAYRADRAKYPVRLVQFYVQGHLHRYFTNVLDPLQLSVADIARLYARRWDIEMAFGLLKEHLHLGHLWSAKWSVIQVQIWCGLLLAQVFHGLQLELAAQEGIDPFEISMDLLVQLVPQLVQRGIAPLPYLSRKGRELGVIRPSARRPIEVPFVDTSWITPAPAEALRPRDKARSAQRKCKPRATSPTSRTRKKGRS